MSCAKQTFTGLTPDQFVQNVEADYKDFQTSRP